MKENSSPKKDLSFERLVCKGSGHAVKIVTMEEFSKLDQQAWKVTLKFMLYKTLFQDERVKVKFSKTKVAFCSRCKDFTIIEKNLSRAMIELANAVAPTMKDWKPEVA
jgi:hypothetical protein